MCTSHRHLYIPISLCSCQLHCCHCCLCIFLNKSHRFSTSIPNWALAITKAAFPICIYIPNSLCVSNYSKCISIQHTLKRRYITKCTCLITHCLFIFLLVQRTLNITYVIRRIGSTAPKI